MILTTNDLTKEIADAIGLNGAFEITSMGINAPEDGFVEIALKLVVNKEKFDNFMMETK